MAIPANPPRVHTLGYEYDALRALSGNYRRLTAL
jgi:hypothetical protein